MIHCSCNLFFFLPFSKNAIKKLYSRQKTTLNLEIVKFKKFQVVFTV